MGQLKHFIAEWVPLWARMGGRKLFFLGNNIKCTMCGSNVREFRTNGLSFDVLNERNVVGGKPRENDRCPVCHSVDRTRLMRLYLEKNTAAGSSPIELLHIAPDLGLLLWLKGLPQLKYTGSDLSPRRYSHVPNFVQADLTDTPFEDGQFDIVICSHVLEHVPDDAKAMSELFRIVKPGGKVLALTPLATDDKPTDEEITLTDESERERRFGQWDHVRLYHRHDFVSRLEKTGFDVELWDPYKTYPSEAELGHLNPLEKLPVCTRPA